MLPRLKELSYDDRLHKLNLPTSYDDRLRKLNLPTLTYRRKRNDMIETYKILHKIYDPDVIPNMPLHIGQSDHMTRGDDLKLFETRCTRSKGKRSSCYRVVNTWNSLSQEVIEAPSLN